MATQNPTPQDRAEESELSVRDWGDGSVILHDGDDTGAWIQFNPDDDTVELDEWR